MVYFLLQALMRFACPVRHRRGFILYHDQFLQFGREYVITRSSEVSS